MIDKVRVLTFGILGVRVVLVICKIFSCLILNCNCECDHCCSFRIKSDVCSMLITFIVPGTVTIDLHRFDNGLSEVFGILSEGISHCSSKYDVTGILYMDLILNFIQCMESEQISLFRCLGCSYLVHLISGFKLLPCHCLELVIDILMSSNDMTVSIIYGLEYYRIHVIHVGSVKYELHLDLAIGSSCFESCLSSHIVSIRIPDNFTCDLIDEFAFYGISLSALKVGILNYINESNFGAYLHVGVLSIDRCSSYDFRSIVSDGLKINKSGSALLINCENKLLEDISFVSLAGHLFQDICVIRKSSHCWIRLSLGSELSCSEPDSHPDVGISFLYHGVGDLCCFK